MSAATFCAVSGGSGHPIDVVWAAITEPERLVEWLAAADVFELRVGGAVCLRWLNVPDDIGEWEARGVELDGRDPTAVVRGTVRQLDPPRLLEYETDAMGLVRFELKAVGEETLLTFTNEIVLPDILPPAQSLASRHVHLDTLERALAGEPADWPRWTEDHMQE